MYFQFTQGNFLTAQKNIFLKMEKSEINQDAYTKLSKLQISLCEEL